MTSPATNYRRYQFSLQTLLSLMTIAAVMFAMLRLVPHSYFRVVPGALCRLAVCLPAMALVLGWSMRRKRRISFFMGLFGALVGSAVVGVPTGLYGAEQYVFLAIAVLVTSNLGAVFFLICSQPIERLFPRTDWPERLKRTKAEQLQTEQANVERLPEGIESP